MNVLQLHQKLPGALANWRAHLPKLVTVLLVLLIAHTAATLTWAIFAPPEGIQPLGAGNRVSTSTPSKNVIAELANLELFGAEEQVAPTSTISAPETQLNLQVRGVFAGDDEATSRAIIANGNTERSYRIGDAIVQGVTVHAILPDRVIISRRGNLESVSLPKDSGVLDGGAAETVYSAPDFDPSIVAEGLAAQPPSPEQAMASITEIVRPIPYAQDGKQIGYRVYPGRARKKFTDLGLQAGDIITSINSVQLDDPELGVEAFQDLGDESSVTVGLIRDGQEQQLVLQTGN